MKFAFIAKYRHIWPINWLCDALDVSRSGFYAWLKRPPSARASHDAKLFTAIDKSFKASDRTYGARRVWHDVLETGLACGLHRVERLMRQNALKARPKRRGKPKDDGERSVIGPEHTGSRLQGRPPEPEVVGRLHLHLDRRGLALRCGRPRSVLTPDRWLVHEG